MIWKVDTVEESLRTQWL